MKRSGCSRKSAEYVYRVPKRTGRVASVYTVYKGLDGGAHATSKTRVGHPAERASFRSGHRETVKGAAKKLTVEGRWDTGGSEMKNEWALVRYTHRS